MPIWDTSNRIFASFNTLFSRIVNKPNASIVGPTKTLTGEFPEQVTFERLYEFYNGWPQIKRSIDVQHQKFIGAGIKVTSNNQRFNTFVERWWEIVNVDDKLSEYFLSTFICGTGLLERQFTEDGKLGNVEHIPMQTIFRIFRDQFANDLKIVQVIDGVFKEIDPQFYMKWAINNPDRQAFGKSEFFTLAAPRRVTARVDPLTGQPANTERNMISLLDAQAVLQNAEIEIKKKMAKPRVFASFTGMPSDQLQKLEKELDDPNSDKYIWAFNKEAKMSETQIGSMSKFDKYQEDIDNMISLGTGMPEKIITNPGGFSYASSQTPMDVMDQRMATLQVEASELIIDELLRPLADTWGFDNFDDMEVEVTFMPAIRRLRMEEIIAFPDNVVPAEEKRELLKQQQIPLDDEIFNGVMAKQAMQLQNTNQMELDKMNMDRDRMSMDNDFNKGKLDIEKQKIKPPSFPKPMQDQFSQDKPVPTIKNVKNIPNVTEAMMKQFMKNPKAFEEYVIAVVEAGIGPTRPMFKRINAKQDIFVPTPEDNKHLAPVGPSAVALPDQVPNVGIPGTHQVANTQSQMLNNVSVPPDSEPPQITNPTVLHDLDPSEPGRDPMDPHRAPDHPEGFPENPASDQPVDIDDNPLAQPNIATTDPHVMQPKDAGSGRVVTSLPTMKPVLTNDDKAPTVPSNNEPNPQGMIVPDKQITIFPEQAQQPKGVGSGVTPNLIKKQIKRKRGENVKRKTRKRKTTKK